MRIQKLMNYILDKEFPKRVTTYRTRRRQFKIYITLMYTIDLTSQG